MKTYTLNQRIRDDDKVTYIQGEKAALTAYANAIVQLVKDINGEYVTELMDCEITDEDAKSNALDSLYDIRDCVKIYIKH